MSVTIPESHKNLLTDPVYVTLSTVMADGQPQSSVVWCSYDGNYILVNTVRGRLKEKNAIARPKVSILALDPHNPYRYLEVRGQVAEITEAGAAAHIDELARQYTEASSYYGGVAPANQADQETRVILKIKPTRVVARGG